MGNDQMVKDHRLTAIVTLVLLLLFCC